MKASIITVSLNSEKTIGRTIKSINKQVDINLEHIFIDGNSSDNTMSIIKAESHSESKIISGNDSGLYNAMNKGIEISDGDFVGILNSDDWYADKYVLRDVKNSFKDNNLDFVYGDIKLFSKNGNITRHWKAGARCEKKLKGEQIPHPAFFVRKSALERVTPKFDEKYSIAADLKQQLILINKFGCKGKYIPRTLTNMSTGGVSNANLSAYMTNWKQSIAAYNEIMGSGGILFVFTKVLKKILKIT